MTRGSMKTVWLAAVCLAGMRVDAGVVAQGMPSGPPANLRGGSFQSVIEEMWRDSPSFRRQCQRLLAATDLTVTIRAERREWPAPRARTFISRRRGIPTSAEVVLAQPGEAIELIAHELEHVIEQLDGIEREITRAGGTVDPRRGDHDDPLAADLGQQ